MRIFNKKQSPVPVPFCPPDVYLNRDVLMSLKTVTGELFTYTSYDTMRNGASYYTVEHRMDQILERAGHTIECADADGAAIHVVVQHIVWYKRIKEGEWR